MYDKWHFPWLVHEGVCSGSETFSKEKKSSEDDSFTGLCTITSVKRWTWEGLSGRCFYLQMLLPLSTKRTKRWSNTSKALSEVTFNWRSRWWSGSYLTFKIGEYENSWMMGCFFMGWNSTRIFSKSVGKNCVRRLFLKQMIHYKFFLLNSVRLRIFLINYRMIISYFNRFLMKSYSLIF